MPVALLGRRRAVPVYLLVALLVVAAATTLLSRSPAHALSGRRICRYVWAQNVGNPEGRQVSFVVDYKKDGKCPRIDLHKVALPATLGAYMPPPDTWENPPEPKLTCEQFQHLMGLPSSGDGGDPCSYMSDDRFFGVTTSLPSDTGHEQRLWDLGSVWDLRP
ncbi:MAG TPA: hypothetical protein VI248_11580 [Kineosporiaceae bacterium]